jgi:hypothetical protein
MHLIDDLPPTRKRPRAVRRFRPADATRYHQAATLIPRRLRQAWARAANQEFACTGDEAAAIAAGNFELNCRVDEAEIERRQNLILDAEDVGELPAVRDDRGLIRLAILDDGGGAEFNFIGHRVAAETYTASSIEVGRYLTLSAVAERQRRAAGRPQ